MKERSRPEIRKVNTAESLQFKMLLSIAFLWFFSYAVARKLTLRRPDIAGESCFQTARRCAYSVVPYAFMRV
jgi:hypothetical protein